MRTALSMSALIVALTYGINNGLEPTVFMIVLAHLGCSVAMMQDILEVKRKK